jgi:hypothetical protein
MIRSKLVSIVLAISTIAATFVAPVPAAADIPGLTGAQTTINPIENTIQPLPALKPISCPNISWLLGQGTTCEDINGWIIVYNQYVSVYNKTQQEIRKNLDYARYGTAVATDSAANVNNVEALLNQANMLSWANTQQDAVVQKTQAAITAGIPPAQMDAQLNQQMLTNITTTLQSMNLLNTQDLTHSSVADQISIAASHATSSLQAEQMVVQILRVMSEQLSTLIRVDMTKISAGEENAWIAAQRDLAAQAARQTQEQQLQQQLLPSPAPSP